ncbi:MAG: helix-turn-helix transcriptional regulator [Akkermansia sp.]
MTPSVNFREIREQAGMTLSEVSELSGYSIAAVNALELSDKGSKRLKEKILSILLHRGEEGEKSEVQHWRDRALRAEEKLSMLRGAMEGWLKKF